MVSLFRSATLEDWTAPMYMRMCTCATHGYGGHEALSTLSTAACAVLGALFVIGFLLLATMIVLHPFGAAIMRRS